MIENLVIAVLPDGWAGHYDVILCLLSLRHICVIILAFKTLGKGIGDMILLYENEN